ncbi:hypothetical protein Dimus_001665 [Dionaea muscipula]
MLSRRLVVGRRAGDGWSAAEQATTSVPSRRRPKRQMAEEAAEDADGRGGHRSGEFNGELQTISHIPNQWRLGGFYRGRTPTRPPNRPPTRRWWTMKMLSEQARVRDEDGRACLGGKRRARNRWWWPAEQAAMPSRRGDGHGQLPSKRWTKMKPSTVMEAEQARVRDEDGRACLGGKRRASNRWWWPVEQAAMSSRRGDGDGQPPSKRWTKMKPSTVMEAEQENEGWRR